MGTIVQSAMHLTGKGEAPEGVTPYQPPKAKKKNSTEQKEDTMNTRAHEEIKLEYISPESCIRYERNSRTHSAAQVEQIKRSIQEFGFTNPVILDEDNVIIAGHGRIEAALNLHLDAIPAIRLVGLPDAKKKALRIADNKLPLNAGWDEESLKLELIDLKAEDFSLELLGFSADELDFYMEDVDIDAFFEQKDETPAGDAEEKTKECIKCPHCGELIEVE